MATQIPPGVNPSHWCIGVRELHEFLLVWGSHFLDFFDRLSGGKRSASGRRLQAGERWITDAPARSAGCLQACPVGRSVTHVGADRGDGKWV